MSDHILDATKMIQDTPRTDKILFSVDVCDGEDVVNIAFARQLERELNAAQDRIKRLEEEIDALRADLLLWNEKDPQ